MTFMLLNLSEEQKIYLIFFSIIGIGICGILYLIKIKYEKKVKNEFIKKFLEKL